MPASMMTRPSRMSPDRFALADFELERTAESVRSSRPEWVMGIGKLEWEKLYG